MVTLKKAASVSVGAGIVSHEVEAECCYTCEEIGTRERQRIFLPTESTHKPSQKSHATLRLIYHLSEFNHMAMLSCKGPWKNIIFCRAQN